MVHRPGGAIGDHLMVTPGLRGLREKFPKARISLSVKQAIRPIYFNNPNINAFVGHYRRGKALESFANKYDLFINIKNCIERNPIAEVENAYDLICSRLQVKPSNMLPDIFLTDDEHKSAKKALVSMGLLPTEKGLILIQGEASSICRCLSQTTTWRIARYFARKGYKVGILGVSGQRSMKFTEPNIIPTHDYTNKFGIRIMFAILRFACLFVGVDSGFSHAAAALRIPSVLLYGPFDSYLRAKYFSNAICIQAKVKCGPCQGHFFGKGYCPMYPKEIPECMATFTCNDIVTTAEQVLAAGVPDSTAKSLKIPISYNSPRNCPFCGDMNSRLYKRISRTIYFECNSCLSIFDYRRKSHTVKEIKSVKRLIGAKFEEKWLRSANIRNWFKKIIHICLNEEHINPNNVPRMDCVDFDTCVTSIDLGTVVDKSTNIMDHLENKHNGDLGKKQSINNQNAETAISSHATILFIKNMNHFSFPRQVLATALRSTPKIETIVILFRVRDRQLKRDTTILFPQADFLATLPTKQGFECLLNGDDWFIERYLQIKSWPNNKAVVLKLKCHGNLTQKKRTWVIQ